MSEIRTNKRFTKMNQPMVFYASDEMTMSFYLRENNYGLVVI